MPQIGWLSDSGHKVPFSEALEISAAEGSWSGFPHEALVLMYRQQTKERPDGISVTQLLGCPRKVYLEKTNDWFTPPADNWATMRGDLVHALLQETGGEDAEVEVRHERTYRGVTMSGQPDSVRVLRNGKRRLIRDWKSTAKLPWGDSAYPSHRKQVNIYRWLLDLPTRFTDLEIVYISMEGIKVAPLKRGGTSAYGRRIENQVMTDEEVEAFLDERLLPLNKQNETQTPIPYAEVAEDDLWNCAFCPVKNVCYNLAAREAKEAFSEGRDIGRVPPRQRKERR